MIGRRYWSTGITVHYLPDNTSRSGNEITAVPWWAKLQFLDSGFCDNSSTEGTLYTRYGLPTIGDAIDLLKGDAERFGIEWRAQPSLYVDGDGELPNVPLPADWRELLSAEAKRLGWETYDRFSHIDPSGGPSDG